MATFLNTKSKSIRNWRTFSLRSLLVITVLSSIALGYIGRRLIPQSTDTTLVEKLQALGADISYDYEAIRQRDIQPQHLGSGRSGIFGNYPDGEVVSVRWQGHGTSRLLQKTGNGS
jgi:hypothetical protein